MEDRVHVGDAVWGGCGGLGAAAARGSWPPAHVGGVRSGGNGAVRAESCERAGAHAVTVVLHIRGRRAGGA